MAGSYPDAPSRRMGIDADGTVGVWFTATNPGPPVEFSASEMAGLNSEQGSGTSIRNDQSWFACFIFPELRELDGIFVAHGRSIFDVESSADTTNGQDGSWTQRIADMPDTDRSAVYQYYRDRIQSMAVASQRAVRVRLDQGVGAGSALGACHLYGEISPGETPDRLLFIDEATGLEFSLPVDFGDIPRGSAREWQFRLKNNSTPAGNNLTINSIQITAESLYLGSGNWYTFDVGGSGHQGTQQIGSLAPEAESPLITGRQVIPTNEVLGKHAARVRASHGSLS